jgi:dTDP-4-dehydrorhamnose reductase
MNIGELKEQADLSYDIAAAKKNALERAESRQIIAHNGHLFRADPQTICLVKTLSENKDTFFVLDSNSNPCEIKDPADFLKKLIERNQETLNAYHQINEEFVKRR